MRANCQSTLRKDPWDSLVAERVSVPPPHSAAPLTYAWMPTYISLPHVRQNRISPDRSATSVCDGSDT